ncbi:MAG TPA: SURF1 family protein [Methylophilaceae bacterium]|nr:SURF1 family protein [Methylophilaceae bacterium]
MSNLQFRFTDYRFSPTWLGTVITICCIPLFIKLGLWQYGKAEHKQALQASYERYSTAPPAQLPDAIENIEGWRYRPVAVQGEYLPQYQILLDNQVEGEVAGYHVITPVQIANSKRIVLVDRGWIPARDSHADLPEITTPTGPQSIVGKVWVPTAKFYTLESKRPLNSKANAWQPIWQNLDMARYQSSVPLDALPFVIRLNADSNAGGFVRNWVMPADRVMTNISYAYQWFGFAVAALLIYFYVSLKKIKQSD